MVTASPVAEAQRADLLSKVSILRLHWLPRASPQSSQLVEPPPQAAATVFAQRHLSVPLAAKATPKPQHALPGSQQLAQVPEAAVSALAQRLLSAPQAAKATPIPWAALRTMGSLLVEVAAVAAVAQRQLSAPLAAKAPPQPWPALRRTLGSQLVELPQEAAVPPLAQRGFRATPLLHAGLVPT